LAADPSFAKLISLACHDLRTPLATVHGFARTLERVEPLSEQTQRYVGMIAAASQEMVSLLDELALVARIEGSRYEPVPEEVDSLALARAAAERVEAGEAGASGEGATVSVDREPTERGLAALATCAIRHGGVERVAFAVDGPEIRLTPVAANVAPILLAEDLRDLGAAVAGRLLEALGGSIGMSADALEIRLPTSAGERAGGP
jgi:signal transduction histidine kinase